MKQKLLKLLTTLGCLCSLAAFGTACNKNNSPAPAPPPEMSKTELFIDIFDLDVIGVHYRYDIKELFEETFSEYSFSEGQKGVQIRYYANRYSLEEKVALGALSDIFLRPIDELKSSTTLELFTTCDDLLTLGAVNELNQYEEMVRESSPISEKIDQDLLNVYNGGSQEVKCLPLDIESAFNNSYFAAISSDCKNLELAKTFISFLYSEKCLTMYDNENPHTFDLKSCRFEFTSPYYKHDIASTPTCTTPGKKYYHCVCEKLGTETYETEIVSHVFNNDQCIWCNTTRYIDNNALYYSINDNTEYELIYIDNESIENVIIPDTINQKPVTKITDHALSNCTNLKSIIIGRNIKQIGEQILSVYISPTVYYLGSKDDWNNIEITYNVSLLKNLYYYSETPPTLNAAGTAYDGNYWHYIDDIPTIWIYTTE